ncbi:heme peroxidase [Mycena rebaudengoi]|nr:heme peroxidase [Mycena rebaudengoi]
MASLAVLACLATVTVNAYIWPSPQLDALEGHRFDQKLFGAGAGMSSFTDPCDSFGFSSTENSGRANVADWIRTAYHDMATHNVEDGTGGMDASIRFREEQERAENVGTGFKNTITALLSEANRHISLADILALAAIMAVENCGGPEIAFRGGRVDAGEPNKPGVPNPTQDIDSHIASFTRQGFTKTEMIGLVACGHTFGGVQHEQFPDIVPELNDPDSTLSVAHFDPTFAQFDNNVATEYIEGTTRNPLVVGLNDTTNSDKRIFGSDGNVTMRSFANSPKLFASTCADLFARMIDTVPRGVKLTEVITPLPVKPALLQLVLAGNQLKFSGYVRFWNMQNDPNRQVRMLWEDHVGGENNVTLPFDSVHTVIGARYTSAWYGFPTKATPFMLLDAAAGITKMRFTVDNKLEDQGGIGFEVQDGVVFAETSCVTARDAEGIPTAGHFDIGVRNGLNPTRVYLERDAPDSVGRQIVLESEISPPVQPVQANSTYSIWSIAINDTNAYNIGAEVDGVKISLTDKHALDDFPDLPDCAA